MKMCEYREQDRGREHQGDRGEADSMDVAFGDRGDRDRHIHLVSPSSLV